MFPNVSAPIKLIDLSKIVKKSRYSSISIWNLSVTFYRLFPLILLLLLDLIHFGLNRKLLHFCSCFATLGESPNVFSFPIHYIIFLFLRRSSEVVVSVSKLCQSLPCNVAHFETIWVSIASRGSVTLRAYLQITKEKFLNISYCLLYLLTVFDSKSHFIPSFSKTNMKAFYLFISTYTFENLFVVLFFGLNIFSSKKFFTKKSVSTLQNCWYYKRPVFNRRFYYRETFFDPK